MTGRDDGPTRGAFEQADDARWQASPVWAFVVRSVVFLGPIVGAFLGLLLLADVLIRPGGVLGTIVWFVQGLIVGTVISMTLDRLTKALLPLATLFTMSLMFPDQAPSRFGVALRAGTLRRLEREVTGDQSKVLGDDVAAAAIRAIEYVTALGRHDRLTRGHTERVRAYADLIATQLGLSDTDRAKLTWGVMLHDIGKMAVPPEILNKTERLTDEEWAVLKDHPAAGGRMLAPLRDWLGPWALAASEHHERWDGGGYPRGLRGDQISLAGRITAVADAYDVITSKRSYKEPMTPAAARRELVVCSGTQFDPDVVRAFLNVSIGRRWSGGFLAAASHLPLGNLGSAPAAVTIGAIVTGGAMVSGVPPPDVVETLAFDDAPTIVETIDETTTSLPTTSAPTSEPVVAPDEADTTTGPTGPPTTEPTTTELSTTTTTTTTAPTTTTTAPVTTASPTTTSTAPTTTATTAPPTTTTTAPPTTTTTTAPTTTTTTAPPGAVYYLENPNSDGQNTTAQLLKQLVLDPPVDPTQYNFDTNRDGDPGVPGLRLLPTGSGWSENDTAHIQRFFLDAGSLTLTGSSILRLWAATDTDGATATLRVSVADCTWTGNPAYCSASLGEATATTTTWVGAGFEELVFDLGTLSHSFGSGRYLVVRVITEGSETVHTAFDSLVHPSRIDLDLS